MRSFIVKEKMLLHFVQNFTVIYFKIPFKMFYLGALVFNSQNIQGTRNF